MSIKSGKMTGLIALVAATDTTVSNPATGTSHEFYRIVVTDTSGASNTVDLYLADTAASAATKRIDKLTLGLNETKSFLPVGVPSGKFLIARATGAATLHGEYIYRDGADV